MITSHIMDFKSQNPTEVNTFELNTVSIDEITQIDQQNVAIKLTEVRLQNRRIFE